MNTNQIRIIANKQIDLYGTEWFCVKAIDENTIYSFNRAYDFKVDERRPVLTRFRTGKVLIHRFTTR
jgi:hypothetical protein